MDGFVVQSFIFSRLKCVHCIRSGRAKFSADFVNNIAVAGEIFARKSNKNSG